MIDRRFVFIAPTYNAEKTLRRALLSIAAQSYENWHIIFIDDVSTDATVRTFLELLRNLGIEKKVTCVFNKEKKWEVENVLQGLKLCKDDDIVARMDFDDYLLDLNALEIINRIYKENPNFDVIWSAHRWFDDNGITPTNISASLPAKANPYVHPWVSSHFKTFKKHLLNNVSDKNYRGDDGNYFKRIGDQAFMLPALAQAQSWHYVPIAMYAYRCNMKPETFQTDDAKFQASEARFLRERGFVK